MPKSKDETRWNKEMGRRIVEAQKTAGIHDYALAGACEMSVRDLTLYKQGARSMRTRRLCLLAKTLNVSADWLLGLG